MTTQTRRDLVPLILVALLAAILAGASSHRAGAATARSGNSLLVAFADGDVIGTYDHTGQSDARTNVDWTFTILMRGNAEIDKVKSILNATYTDTGGSMYEYLNDSAGYSWDSDRGRKQPASCSGRDTHMRLYADGDDRLYNRTDGYYIVGTTHYDYRDISGCSGYYGWSEAASNEFCNYFQAHGKSCTRNAIFAYNAEPYRQEGNHYWSNDGNLHRVNIP